MRKNNNRYTGLAVMLAGSIFFITSNPNSVTQSIDSVPSTGQFVFGIGQFASHSAGEHLALGSGHFCGTDFTSQESKGAQSRFLEAKRNGTLQRSRKFSSQPDIGDEAQFRIIDQLGTENAAWVPKVFELVDKEPDAFYFWVDKEELAELTPAELSGLRSALLENTPAGSVDPSKGILFNNETYFGAPPNYDGDNHTDVLFYDIGGPNSTVRGFVSSVDIDPLAADTVGNQADVLYLDSRSPLSSLAPIAAHEHTHLLHLAAGFDLNYTFATEGFAEYAIVLNGYPTWRAIRYLPVSYIEEALPNRYEYTRSLFNWRTDQLGGDDPQLYDYQRGNFLFGYIGEHFGPNAVGRMLQGEMKGPEGVDSILVVEGSSLKDLLPDFHTANYINDQTINPRYGHPIPGRPQGLAGPTRTFDGEQLINGPEGPEYITILDAYEVRGGAAHYMKWINVSDFFLEFDVFGANGFPEDVVAFQRKNMVARVIGERPDGSLEFFDVEPRQDFYRFNGRFQSLTVLITHIDPSLGSGGRYDLFATWIPLSQATDTGVLDVPETVFALEQNFPNPFSQETTIGFELDRPSKTRVQVFDVLGRKVATLLDEQLAAGRHEARFSAPNLSSGVYFYRIEADGHAETRPMRVIR